MDRAAISSARRTPEFFEDDFMIEGIVQPILILLSLIWKLPLRREVLSQFLCNFVAEFNQGFIFDTYIWLQRVSYIL